MTALVCPLQYVALRHTTDWGINHNNKFTQQCLSENQDDVIFYDPSKGHAVFTAQYKSSNMKYESRK